MNTFTNALIIFYGNLILASLATNTIAKIGFFILAAIALIAALTAENK